jgi:hypothetical protein
VRGNRPAVFLVYACQSTSFNIDTQSPEASLSPLHGLAGFASAGEAGANNGALFTPPQQLAATGSSLFARLAITEVCCYFAGAFGGVGGERLLL